MPHQNETERHMDLGQIDARMRKAQRSAYRVVSKEEAADRSRRRGYGLGVLAVLVTVLLVMVVMRSA